MSNPTSFVNQNKWWHSIPNFLFIVSAAKKQRNLPNKENVITRKGQALFDQELSIGSRRHDLFCLVTSYFPMEPTVKKKKSTFSEVISLSKNLLTDAGLNPHVVDKTRLDWKLLESIKCESNMNQSHGFFFWFSYKYTTPEQPFKGGACFSWHAVR